MATADITNLLIYNPNNDISYLEYNKQGLPYMFDSTYIYHSNQNYNDGSYSQQLRTIRNNLIIESADSNIVLSTIPDKKVIVKNNMAVNNNLDVSNIITTNNINTKDISLAGILYLTNSGNINVIGNLNVQGGLTFTDTTDKQEGFTGRKSYFTTSTFYNGDISDSRIFYSDIYDSKIMNSYISDSVIGYDKSNNIVRNKAVFSTVSMESLTFDGSLTSQNYIKFPNNSNADNPIIIKSSDDYSKLEINKPLIVGPRQINTNISNISIFNGDISCNILYYSHLNPDVRLNKYFDISIGHVSLSGNIIPTITNTFTIGSTNYKFNNIYSTTFIGDLSGTASLANNLKKNLDMSFNNLDISGIIRLNGSNLNQTLQGTYITISGADLSFQELRGRIISLSGNVYSRSFVDICLNTNYLKNTTFELSFQELSGIIFGLSGNVYSRSFVDICLNTNYAKTSSTNATQFKIFEKFTFENSGNYIQQTDSPYNSTIISEWRTNWLSANNPVIRFHADGSITNINNSYSGWSDIRLKENIVDTGPKLQDLLKVRVVNYNLKGSASTYKHIGVIAQELETIFPNLITENEPTIEDIKNGKTESFKSVKYSCFTLMLIKALQEEQEIINKLDSRILTLNEEYNMFKDLHERTNLIKDDINSLKEENILLKSKLNQILSMLGKNKIS